MTLDIIYLTKDFEPVETDDPRMFMVKTRDKDGRVVFGFPEKVQKNILFHSGGEGSGDFDHSGRPGMVGGSGKGESRLKEFPVEQGSKWFEGRYGDEISLKEIGFITEKPALYGGYPGIKSPKYVQMEFQPSQLHVAQSTVTKDLVGKKMRGEWDDLELPLVVKNGNEYYLMSGNHMAVAQYLRDDKITANVIEYDKKVEKYIRPKGQ